jgi:hypothetical protein
MGKTLAFWVLAHLPMQPEHYDALEDAILFSWEILGRIWEGGWDGIDVFKLGA